MASCFSAARLDGGLLVYICEDVEPLDRAGHAGVSDQLLVSAVLDCGGWHQSCGLGISSWHEAAIGLNRASTVKLLPVPTTFAVVGGPQDAEVVMVGECLPWWSPGSLSQSGM
jgi:hypothetical protein